MHELGIMYNVVKTVSRHAEMNNVSKIHKIVLEIGEMSPVVPKYIKDCYPAAVDGTSMEKTELELQIIKAVALCRDCGKEFSVVENKGYCPKCGERNFDLNSGKEFNIKEIHAE